MNKREIILGWIYLPVQLFLIPTVIVLINMIYGSPMSDTEINFIYFCVNFIGATVIFWEFLRDNGKIALGNVGRCLQSAFFGFGLYWILSIIMGYLIMTLYPDFYNVNDESINIMVQENAKLMAFGTVLLVPITEEVLYRGLVFQGLYNHNRVLAYAVSMVVFSLLHIIGYIGTYEPFHLFLCFLQYLPAGFCLGWAYARADSIWAPILIHISINQIGMLSMM